MALEGIASAPGGFNGLPDGHSVAIRHLVEDGPGIAVGSERAFAPGLVW
jgi:hypothetical protein